MRLRLLLSSQAAIFLAMSAAFGAGPGGLNPSCSLWEKLRRLLPAELRTDLKDSLAEVRRAQEAFQPMSPEAIARVEEFPRAEEFSLSGVYKIEGPEGLQVIRVASEKADLRREAFASALFRVLPATRASTVRYLNGEEAERILARLRELRPKDPKLSGDRLTVASFERGDKLILTDFGLSDDASTARIFTESGPGKVPAEVLQSVADLWTTCHLLGIFDCHDHNFVMNGVEAVAVDLAFPARWWKEPFPPLGASKVDMARDIPAILGRTSDKLVWGLGELSGRRLEEIAEIAGYPIRDMEIMQILQRRDWILKEISKARR